MHVVPPVEPAEYEDFVAVQVDGRVGPAAAGLGALDAQGGPDVGPRILRKHKFRRRFKSKSSSQPFVDGSFRNDAHKAYDGVGVKSLGFFLIEPGANLRVGLVASTPEYVDAIVDGGGGVEVAAQRNLAGAAEHLPLARVQVEPEDVGLQEVQAVLATPEHVHEVVNHAGRVPVLRGGALPESFGPSPPVGPGVEGEDIVARPHVVPPAEEEDLLAVDHHRVAVAAEGPAGLEAVPDRIRFRQFQPPNETYKRKPDLNSRKAHLLRRIIKIRKIFANLSKFKRVENVGE